MKNLKANRLLSIAVRTQGRALHGWLRRSERPLGLALLLAAPASSSERACLLAQARIASLAIDLESPEDAQHRPGMDQLCSRLYDVIQWLRGRADTRLLPLGCVAAGRNGAAAVIEAVRQPASMRGIALRDADLRDARPWLQRLSVPLFLHAGDDTALVEGHEQHIGGRARR